MDSTRYTVLLVPDERCADALRRALSARYASDIRFEIVSEPVVTAVPLARDRHGGVPLGYVGTDEASTLEALSQGADEALAWPPTGEPAIQGFFDRLMLRAGLRREQEQLRASVVHSEKLAALGTLVAGVAHEVNNPLTALQLCVDACRSLLAPAMDVASELRGLRGRGRGATQEEVEALCVRARTGASSREGLNLLDEMTVASQAIADIVRDLRVFARSDQRTEKRRVIDVADLVDQSLRLVGREIEASGMVERDYSPDVPKVLAPPGRLHQVLINVFVNAAHALKEVQRPSHRVRVSTRADDEHVAITISDTGPGIAPEALDHIFDPFFTTKRVGTGTGLGLSISRSIMQEMGGDLIVTSVHGDGATFIALIPISDPATLMEAMRTSSAPIMAPKHVQRPNVLCIDDDGNVLKAYSRALGHRCNVILAADGQEAIELLSSGSSPDVIITELDLPEVDGIALYDWLRESRPSLARRTVFVTADGGHSRYENFVATLPNGALLHKPVDAAGLIAAIEQAVTR